MLTISEVTTPTSRVKNTKRRPVSYNKACLVRNKIQNGLGAARVAIEEAIRRGVPLEVWTNQAGELCRFTQMQAAIIEILMERIAAEAAEAEAEANGEPFVFEAA